MQFSNFMFYEMAMRSGSNLALYAHPGYLVLWEPSPLWKNALNQQDIEPVQNLVYGIMEMRDNTIYKTWEVDAVYAQQGFGPYTYLIAMSLVYPDGLSPTRVATQITPKAKGVWTEFYSGKGKELVTPEQLPHDASHHKEPYMNCKYIIKKPIPTRPMIKKSDMFFRHDRRGEWKDLFMEMTVGLLKSQLAEIY